MTVFEQAKLAGLSALRRRSLIVSGAALCHVGGPGIDGLHGLEV